MTTLEVIDGLRKSQLSEQSLVWRIGMHDWTRVADVPQLRLAAGSTRPPPPAAARATQSPFPTQAEGLRPRSTLPLGFPGLNARASVRPPATISSRPTPVVAAVAFPDQPLAVYDRPSASLTFSASGRAEWQGTVDSSRFTPAPPIAAAVPVAVPFTRSLSSTLPSSLAPTTAEVAAGARLRGPAAWGDLDELLSNERLADQRRSRRVVLGASLGSATVAAIFALYVLRSSPPRSDPPAQAAHARPPIQASPTPPPAPTLEAVAAPSTSVLEPAPSALRVAPQRVAPRSARRPKATTATAAPSGASVDSPAPTPGATPEVAAAPAAPPENAPAATEVTAATETVPTPPAPIAPDRP